MIQGRSGFRLVNKAFLSTRVSDHFRREKLESNESVKFEVLGLVDDAHAALTELFNDLVVADSRADHVDWLVG
jgi:hypothetical protein